MNDDEFQQVIRRVENNKSEQTATQYIAKIRDFREWLQDRSRAFKDADAIDVEDWLADLDEKYTNASSVGKGEAALVAAYDELNKLIQSDRIEGDNSEWGRFGTPADQADYSPQDSSSFKSRETREDVEYLKPAEVDELACSVESAEGDRSESFCTPFRTAVKGIRKWNLGRESEDQGHWVNQSNSSTMKSEMIASSEIVIPVRSWDSTEQTGAEYRTPPRRVDDSTTVPDWFASDRTL